MNFSFDKKFFFFLLFVFVIYFQGVLNLPVLDRDEARFATASKTMLIEQEYIDIKMVDEPRYKKPIGIYWSQVLSNKILGSYPFNEIWIYRLPSIVSFFLCILFIYCYLQKYEKKITIYLTIFFLTFCLLTISEIHQSKTDALLFMLVSICNLILYKTIKLKNINNYELFSFWVCMALGVLVKGPIILIFIIIPLLVFSIIKKKNIFKFFWSAPAFLLFLLISVPWFILINIKSGGVFWHESVGNDLFNKIKSGQESHGFPPGYYTILFFIFFWPGSIFFYSLFKNLKSNFQAILKKDDFKLILIVSFLAPFIIFELIPTKLPHYVYPCYLPMSILISKLIVDEKFDSNKIKSSIFTLILYPIIITTLICYSVFEYGKPDSSLLLVICFNIFLIFLLTLFRFRTSLKKFITYTGLFQISVYLVLVFFLIPRIEKLWVSQNINNLIKKYENNFDHILAYGFNEPSLLFLTSHSSLNNVSLNEISKEDIRNKKFLIILTKDLSQKIKKQDRFRNLVLINQITGFNYSKGKEVNIMVYQN